MHGNVAGMQAGDVITEMIKAHPKQAGAERVSRPALRQLLLGLLMVVVHERADVCLAALGEPIDPALVPHEAAGAPTRARVDREVRRDTAPHRCRRIDAELRNLANAGVGHLVLVGDGVNAALLDHSGAPPDERAAVVRPCVKVHLREAVLLVPEVRQRPIHERGLVLLETNGGAQVPGVVQHGGVLLARVLVVERGPLHLPVAADLLGTALHTCKSIMCMHSHAASNAASPDFKHALHGHYLASDRSQCMLDEIHTCV